MNPFRRHPELVSGSTARRERVFADGWMPKRVRHDRWWRILALLLLLFVAPAQAQTFPAFTGLVVDAANVLPEGTKAELTAKLGALQRDTGRQLVVATIPDLQGYPLEDYGYKLGRAWAVGLKGLNNGAILFIAPNEQPGHRGPRVEVGYGLEPVLTDAFSSVVINATMMPRLKAGDVAGALDAGADALIQQLRLPDAEATAKVNAAIAQRDKAQRRHRGGIPSSLIFWGIILVFVVLPMLRGGGGRRYRGSIWPVMLWGSGLGGGGGGGSGWGGGGFGGDSGGGGFSGGGGGSFGGGGASGGW